VTSLLAVLHLNGVAISYTQKELVALELGMAARSLNYEAVVEWIRSHLVVQP
jgi:prophage maintenance system killer protein